jgi:hypothetical protein
VRLLDFTPSELQRCTTETDGHLVPRLRALNVPVALFIDGVDEYFNKHVGDAPANATVTGELSRNVWFFAQLGLVEGRLPTIPFVLWRGCRLEGAFP